MGGMLVDDNEPVAGLGNDIGLVNLGARRAERAVHEIAGRLRLEPYVGGGRAHVEGALVLLRECCRGGGEGWRATDRKGRRAPPVPTGRARREGGAERGN